MRLIKSSNLQLRFSTLDDRELIYNMLISPETIHFMFNETHPAPTWDEFCDEDDYFYSGEPSENGSYLMIEHEGKSIGSISYACEYEKTPYCELDIWMASTSKTGKGLGTEAILNVIDFVNGEYGIKHFIIRPWIRNNNAIKAYEKCGFIKESNLDLALYYSDESMVEYGDGDYGKDETVNMIRIIE